MNLLILDDEPLFVEQLEMIIQKNFPDWRIFSTYAGTDAIQVAQKDTIHLALIDIKLGGRSGLEVAEQLKQDNPDLDVVIISAFQEFEYARYSLKLKAVDYLVKPVLEIELLRLLNDYIFQHPQYNSRSSAVGNTIDIIAKRFHEQLKLSSVAEELFIHPQYLSRLFSEEIGMPFSEYLLRYRIKMAKELLVKEKEWSIEQVSFATGFNSQHYFSKAFKRLVQTTPARYRQQKLQELLEKRG
ncbi:helix-turn-helix domain-containing protein [Sporosarcina sp. FSL W7-1349]|uniref:response regulator transcription factor n=1 Tax=Sporosarcina sp. FSL W7-1349 TaxID=2921561 RepID=UPI0030F69A21